MSDNSTNVKVTEVSGPAGQPIIVLRFSGDITSGSSGIALIIQMLMEAAKAGQSIQTFGLSPHFHKA
jgi:anti-anti-sigma regulatory factor